jgi:hypothetical protein
VTGAAVSVMQVVRAACLEDAFDPADQPIPEALLLEGNTTENPHAKNLLAFVAWTIGRVGGWDGYDSKPGPPRRQPRSSWTSDA